MKNGEAILNAFKVLGKELSIGVKAEYDSLRNTTDKIVNEYKEGTLKETVKQQFEKDKAVAESVLTSQVANLEKEIQKLKDQIEAKKQAEKSDAVETVDAEIVEEADEEKDTAVVESAVEETVEEVISEEAAEAAVEEVSVEAEQE